MCVQVLLEVPDEEEGGGKYERVRLLDKRPALSEARSAYNVFIIYMYI